MEKPAIPFTRVQRFVLDGVEFFVFFVRTEDDEVVVLRAYPIGDGSQSMREQLVTGDGERHPRAPRRHG